MRGASSPNSSSSRASSRVDPRALAELVEIELVLLVRSSPRARFLRSARARRGELLADDPQRQELVALQAQDRLEALDVVLAEQAIAALRARGASSP